MNSSLFRQMSAELSGLLTAAKGLIVSIPKLQNSTQRLLVDRASRSLDEYGSRLVGFAFVMVLLVPFLGACTPTETTDPRELTSMVSIEGSDTLADLLDVWAKSFMKENPGIPVSYTIGDSGSGVLALFNRTTDVAATSRDLTEAEQVEKHNKGLHLKRHMVALDSIAVIVSPKNRLDEITLKQLRQVFSGQTESWSELVAEKNEPIDVLIREKNSGTGRYFSEHVLNRQLTPDDAIDKEEFSQKARVMTSNEAMISAVSASDRAVGFVGLNFALSASDKVKLLKVKMLDTSVAVMPSIKSAADDYPLSRPLYLFADVEPKPTVKKFVDFCTADEGQKIARDHGYVTIK